MTYRIQRKRRVVTNFQKIAHDQVQKARAEIGDGEVDRHETVHQVRKRCKKLRGLIRLVRPVFKPYREENVFLRDAARDLSYVRDCQSIIESVDALAEHYGKQVDTDIFNPVREELALRREEVSRESGKIDEKLERFQGKMRALDSRIDDWELEEDGFNAIAGGLQKTYKRGREGFARAYGEPSTENFHEWRKRVKYHWYHTRLLREIWPDLMSVRSQSAHRLADLLGDEHDLAVLQQTLAEDPKRFGGKKRLQVIFGLVDRRRLELRSQARPLGALLFAEKKKHICRRFETFWQTWKHTADMTLGVDAPW